MTESEGLGRRVDALEQRSHDTAVLLRETAAALAEHRRESERQAAALEQLRREIQSVDPREPGLALRLDRLVQKVTTLGAVLAWFGTGGMLGLATSVYVLYRVLNALSSVAAP